MKKQRLFACLMAGAMVLTMTACGNSKSSASDSTSTPVSASTSTSASVEEQKGFEYDDSASITFADEKYGFVGSDSTVNPAAKETAFSVVSRNGRRALKIESAEGGKFFAGIQMDALLGDKIGEVKTVEFALETECKDNGKFVATSGNVYAYLGEDNERSNTPWSIYLEKQNPKKISYELPQTAVAGNSLVLSLEVNDGSSYKADRETALYVYSISFKDAAGNVLPVDTSAEYVKVETGEDRSNLFGIAGAITVDGLVGAGGAWSQIGYQELTDEQFEALKTPGSVVEISYQSSTGNMWMGLSGNAWLRIGVGNADGSGQGFAYVNNSKNIAQIPYEEIVKVCGEDTSAWDKSIFIESDGDFEVFSVKIGRQIPNIVLKDAIDIGLSGTSGAWGQLGYDVVLSDEAIETLRTPGSVVAVEYTSESGDFWIGLSGNAWQRVGVGNADGSGSVDAYTDGNVCYVTYDMIAAVCGEDSSAWDTTIFVESDSNFEVYSVKVGKAAEFKANNKQVDAGISGTGDGWAQIDYGITLSDEALEALKTPGSVVNISYTSESGEIWIVMTSGAEGWKRIGVGDFDGSGQGYAVYDGSLCQITHEMIAEYYGADPSTWGNQFVVEASTAFEVYSVNIGQTK